MQRNKLIARVLMLALLVLLLSGCASVSQPSCVTPAIPPLPAQARQNPAPLWCSPTCSRGLITERENWLKRLTPPASQDKPANEALTR